MIKSEKLYSPQAYLELITGKTFIINGDNDIELIEDILAEEENDLWSYPLSEIDHIVENGLDVVLVDCMVYKKSMYEYEHVLRWFEVPEDFEEELPTDVIIKIPDDIDIVFDENENWLDEVSDFLSNAFGFCHKGFDYRLNSDENNNVVSVFVYNIKWDTTN